MYEPGVALHCDDVEIEEYWGTMASKSGKPRKNIRINAATRANMMM